jgi:hypothetical protein
MEIIAGNKTELLSLSIPTLMIRRANVAEGRGSTFLGCCNVDGGVAGAGHPG